MTADEMFEKLGYEKPILPWDEYDALKCKELGWLE